MPEIPTIVPLTPTGILAGSVLRKTDVGIGQKLPSLGSLLAGLGNRANARAKGAIETVGDIVWRVFRFFFALIERIAF